MQRAENIKRNHEALKRLGLVDDAMTPGSRIIFDADADGASSAKARQPKRRTSTANRTATQPPSLQVRSPGC